LAFGLPILTHIFDSYIKKDPVYFDKTVPQALILTPTRELAIQIKDHLQVCCRYQKTKVNTYYK
jgi:superfamily II DNA/RNA helicase